MVNCYYVQTALVPDVPLASRKSEGEFFCHRQHFQFDAQLRGVKLYILVGSLCCSSLLHDIIFFSLCRGMQVPTNSWPPTRNPRRFKFGKHLVAFISPATNSHAPDSQHIVKGFLSDGPFLILFSYFAYSLRLRAGTSWSKFQTLMRGG